MRVISDNVLDDATEAFHSALDKHVDRDIHGRDGDWVDGDAGEIVEALLQDGWKPPNRCLADAGMRLS